MPEPSELTAISARTLAHYDRHAESFWRGTRDHDVSQIIAALLRAIEGAPPFTILDFGCGPGRDLKVFTDLGHVAVGVDGSERLARLAHEWSGCEFWQGRADRMHDRLNYRRQPGGDWLMERLAP